MDITMFEGSQIRLDNFKQAVKEFKELIETIKRYTNLCIELTEEDMSYKNDLSVEFINAEKTFGVNIGDYGEGIKFMVFSLKCYPATREEPEDFVEYDETEYSHHSFAVRELVKRIIDWNFSIISEEQNYVEESILDIEEPWQ